MIPVDPSTLTPESIIAMATSRGLRLMPGAFLTYRAGEPIGCCASGALAIEADPTVPDHPERVHSALHTTGLSTAFRAGLVTGFDIPAGEPGEDMSPEYLRGHALGQATRRLADAAPAGGGGVA